MPAFTSEKGSENQLGWELLACFYIHSCLFPVPPILALKAMPTVQWELFAAAATSPAQRVPCLQGEHTHFLKEDTSFSQTQHILDAIRLQSGEECSKL